MCITNTNIFQPRILPKPELNETLPKTNLKTTWSDHDPKKPDRREGFSGKKNAPPLRG